MRRVLTIILLIFCFFFVAAVKYSVFNTPPIPFIKSVGLVDGKVFVNYDIDENNLNNDIYCIMIPENEEVKIDDERWELAKNRTCSYEIDENIYTVYLKNKSNKIFKVEETNKLGEVTSISTNKNKIYLPLGGTYTPTLTYTTIGYVDDNITWSSENSDIVSVDENGKITAKKKGNIKVTANYGDKSTEILVVSTDLITKRPKEYDLKKSYLTCDMYSKEENDLLDEILKDRINDVGYQTRAGAVEAARFLALEFPYKIRYFSENGRLTFASKIDGEGRYYHKGLFLHSSRFDNLANSRYGPATWGCNMYSGPSHGTRRNGLDCSGFITWVMYNGGFDVKDVGAGVAYGSLDMTDYGEKTRFTSSLINDGKVRVGDLLSSSGPSGGHIAIIVGEDNDKYYVAESLWYAPYVAVVIVDYSKKTIYNRYYWVMLMDDYYKKDGNLTKLWY